MRSAIAASLLMLSSWSCSDPGSGPSVEILGNYPRTGPQNIVIISGQVGPGHTATDSFGYGLAMGPTSYQLDRVQLRLSVEADGDVAAIAVHGDNGSGLPGSPLAVLAAAQGPTTSEGDVVFMPTGVVTLAAATRYWLVLTPPPGSSSQVHSSTPPAAPAGTGATSLGYALGYEVAIPDEVSPFPASPTFAVEGHTLD